MIAYTDPNTLYNLNASPRSVVQALNAAIISLYNDGHLEQCAQECYTADVKLWTEQKQLVSGTDELIKYFKEAFETGGKIGEVIIEEAMKVGEKHIIAKCKCDYGGEYHHMTLYHFDGDERWRVEWEGDYT